MREWLGLAWVQDGLVPFVAGLVAAELFNRLRLSGLAIAAAVVAAVYVASPGALTIAPKVPIERIALLVIAGTAFGLAFDLLPRIRRWVAVLTALTGGGLVIWAAWPAATLDNWLAVIASAGLGIVYAVWTTGTLTLLADSPERAAAVGVGLAGAVGACAGLVGAATLATIAWAAAAGSGAHWLIQSVSNQRLACGTTFALPLAVVCALIPPVNVLTAAMSWYLLPLLACVSALALIPLSERLQLRVRALLSLGICLAGAAGVVAIAYLVIGPPVKAA
jgi:hypothetical protein